MKSTAADMTKGSISRHLISFAIPMAVGLLFQQLYNTVDTLVVGKFVSTEALAAVGSTGSIITTLVGFCSGIATGAGVVISQCYGAGDEKRMHHVINTTILLTIILSIIATIVGVAVVYPMLYMMSTPADVMDDAAAYLTYYFAGMSGLIMYNMGSGILRAVGDSKRPLYFLIVSAVLNTVLDLVFVIACGMGVEGVALATIVSQFISAIMVMYTLTKVKASYAIHWKGIRIDRRELKQILRMGMPAGIQQAVTSFSNVFVQSYINAFGAACMAGWSIYGKVDAFVVIPLNALSMASSTFIGQNYGAGDYKRARDGTRLTIIQSVVVTSGLCVLLIMMSRAFLGLFSDDATVIDFGQRFINLCTPFYIMCCFFQIYAGALRGVGQAYSTTAVMLGSFVVFRQIYLFVTARLGAGFVAVALAYPIGWCLCSLLTYILYRRCVLFKKHPVAAA